jgi:hypothetical protein
MSRMRKELFDSTWPCMSYESAYFRVLQAVARRRTLIHGRLHASNGHSCAIGCAFDDGVDVLPTRVVDEIAEYNDSFPKLSEKERWAKVMAWLRFRTKAMERK